ncbi:hypothetical protein QBZ16_004229 [Prototheca wickerhamii]|uniref:Uncharacterized protein n=1 Tax=Prototheca wickerhamii TaxID=3111 RepID=A0AAD9MGQ9_PROWI|nr:hypothetical protein QBZ16_004229 [Prototheca wickerhamii]
MTVPVPVLLDDRQRGGPFAAWLARYHVDRLRQLGLRAARVIHAPGLATWLDLEAAESRYLAVASSDGTASLLSHELSPVAVLGRAPAGGAGAAGHRFAVSAVAWYPRDSALVLTAGLDGAVKTWDANAGVVAESFDMGSRVWALALSRLHCLAAVGCEDGSVRLYDLASGTTLHQLGEGHDRAAVWAAAWSPTAEHQLLTGAADGTARLWDVRRWGGSLAVLDFERTSGSEAVSDEAGERLGESMAFATRPDRSAPSRVGSSFASWAARSAVPDPAAQARARGARAHAGPITGLAATPDGRHWLTAGGDDALRCWDAAALTNTLRHFPGAFNRARRPKRLALALAGDAVFAPSGSAALGWDVATGAALCTLRGGHFESINACLWNEATQELYSAGDDRLVLCWGHEGAGAGDEEDEDFH